PNLLAEKVASRIAENFNDTALIMVGISFFNIYFMVSSFSELLRELSNNRGEWQP
ncbi:putative Neighbor of COX4 protein, partial [Naja naja]